MLTTEEKGALPNGDRLSQADFHRIYERCPENLRAELIHGTVIVSSPATADLSDSVGLVVLWSGGYAAKRPEFQLFVDGTVIFAEDCEIQPDVAMVRRVETRGAGRIVNLCLAGPPEFVADIAYSFVSYDGCDKWRVSEQAGVGEYPIVLLQKGRFEWRMRHEKSS